MSLCVRLSAAAKSLQSCPNLCDPIDSSPPGSPVPGILQSRTLEWVAISFSNAWKGKGKLSCSVVSNSQRPHGLQPTRLLCQWDFPGESTGVGCHCLLQCVKVKTLSRVWLSATPWTAAYQAPPSMGFSRQEYCSGVPLPSLKDSENVLLFDLGSTLLWKLADQFMYKDVHMFTTHNSKITEAAQICKYTMVQSWKRKKIYCKHKIHPGLQRQYEERM